MRGLPHVTHNQLGAKKGSPGEYFQMDSILPCHQMLLHIATLSLEKIGTASSHMIVTTSEISLLEKFGKENHQLDRTSSTHIKMSCTVELR
jgi:hypothetical protein